MLLFPKQNDDFYTGWAHKHATTSSLSSNTYRIMYWSYLSCNYVNVDVWNSQHRFMKWQKANCDFILNHFRFSVVRLFLFCFVTLSLCMQRSSIIRQMSLIWSLFVLHNLPVGLIILIKSPAGPTGVNRTFES